MENVGNIYTPIGHVVKRNDKVIGIKKCIKENKIGLAIAGIAVTLLSAYTILIINFINLIKILN